MASSLPSGTITLLFSDIEGSSRLWDTHRSEMAEALAAHNGLMTQAIFRNGGVVVKDKGDGFFAVFTAADSAVGCALDAQRALQTASWPDVIGSIKVRMALHTGMTDSEDDDYHGPVVNRVARLEGIAHGGQVLVSETTRGLVEDALPEGISLLDLGAHSLRGMKRPERVYQLRALDLPADFPPLRTDAGGGIALPTYPTSFVGRSSEQRSIKEMFTGQDGQLVTLLGPGGIGKTRLAVETARSIADELVGGAFFADLTRISNVEDVGLAIAEAVGAHPEGTASNVALAAARVTQPTLLVLDNFEHLQPAAPTVAEFLDHSHHVRLIATSRAPLHIRSERIFRVEPLSSLNGDGPVPPAVALFYERAAGYGVHLAEEGEEAASVASIVRRLDGLPLAIELVAARTRLIGVTELEEMLTKSLDVLGSGAADLPDRQRTIRATIDWSLQALSDSQRRLFSQLSVFPAGATLAEIEHVAGPDLEAGLLDELAGLVDNSLINVVTGLPGGTRYRQLVLLREYGAELLEESGHSDELMGRLVDHYVAVAPELGARLQVSPDPEKEIRAGHANLAEAMEWSLDHERIAEIVDVVCHIWVYWFNGDLAAPAAQWVAKADPLLDIPKLDWLTGFFAFQSGDYEIAATRLLGAMERFRESGDDDWKAMSQTFVGVLVDDLDAGRKMEEAALHHFEANEFGVKDFLSKMFLSSILLALGEEEAAVPMRRELLAWSQTMNYPVLIAWSELTLALGLIGIGAFDEADGHARRGLEQMLTDGYQEGIAGSADVIGGIQHQRGAAEQALRLFGGAEAVYAAIGSARWPEATLMVEIALAKAREELGDAECERLVADGRALSLEALIELVSEA